MNAAMKILLAFIVLQGLAAASRAPSIRGGRDEPRSNSPLVNGSMHGLFDEPIDPTQSADAEIEAATQASGKAQRELQKTYARKEYIAGFSTCVLLLPPIVAIALSFLGFCSVPTCSVKEIHDLQRPSPERSDFPPVVHPLSMRDHISNLLLGEKNRTFAQDAELAIRGAVFGCVVALPFLIPGMKFLLDTGRYSSTALLIFIFTLYKTVGQTINFAFAGMLGTTLAVLNAWCMFGFFPYGVSAEHGTVDDHFLPGVINVILFTAVILSLNFDLNTKMFALSWHMYFLMGFLDPSNTSFSSNFEIKATGPAVGALLQTAIGCGMAVLATIVPYPIYALNLARSDALLVTKTLGKGWIDVVECYCGEFRHPVLEDRVRRDVAQVQEQIINLNSHLGDAWWECLGMGRPQVVRVFLGELNDSLRELFNRLCSAMHSCAQENFEKTHVASVTKLKPFLKKLVVESALLMEMVTVAAMDGDLDEDENALVQNQAAAVKAATEALTREFGSLKGMRSLDQADECAFCLACASYARIAITFADVLQSELHELKPTEAPNITNIFNVKKAFSDEAYRNQFLRRSFAIFVAFLIGYVGYGKLILSFNSAPAGRVAVLFTSGHGADISKNLGCLQGIVLGMIVGQMGFALLFWCSTSGFIAVAIVLFVYLLATLFTYYNATDFSYIACLMAAFGACSLISTGCSNETFNPGSKYSNIINVALAVIIMTIVDQIFLLKRLAKHAHDNLRDAWESYKEATKDLFNPDIVDVRFHTGAIMKKFAVAESFNDLAWREIRYHRTPWKHNLFNHAINAGQHLREAMCCMECGFSEKGVSGGKKIDVLEEMLKLKSFDQVRQDFFQYIDTVDKLLDVFVHEKEGPYMKETGIKPADGKSPMQLAKEHIDVMARELETFVHDRPSAEKKQPIFAYASLEDDFGCRMGMFMTMLQWQFQTMYDLKHTILSDV